MSFYWGTVIINNYVPIKVPEFTINRQTQNICITFVQRRPNVLVGPTLYKCYTNISCLLGMPLCGNLFRATTSDKRPNTMRDHPSGPITKELEKKKNSLCDSCVVC